MVTKQDVFGAEAYMARADRLIEKHRGLIGRSRNRQNVATAMDLIKVLSTFRASVEQRHAQQQRDPAVRDGSDAR